MTIVSVAHTNIPPKEPVTYTKQTQTAAVVHASHDGEFSLQYLTAVIHSQYFHIIHLTMIYPIDVYFPPQSYLLEECDVKNFTVTFVSNSIKLLV